jgi:hypothetical protein
MLSGANAFEISDIEGMHISAHQPRLGRNNVTCPVVSRNNNSPGTPTVGLSLTQDKLVITMAEESGNIWALNAPFSTIGADVTINEPL